jgi:hypothetical protein
VRPFRTCAALSGLTLAGCLQDPPTVPERKEPMLYMVLHQLSAGDSGLHALLTRTGSPILSEFIQASRFEMRRGSDGALFDWRFRPQPAGSGVGLHPTPLTLSANYFLPMTGNGGRLGGQFLRNGQRYVLTVETSSGTIQGSTSIPGSFNITYDSDSAVRWSRAEGAAGYQVVEGAYRLLQLDTVYRPGRFIGVSVPIRVIALDSNLFRYLRGTEQTAAGITGGFGILGGATEGRSP